MARMTARTTRIRDYGAGDAPAIVRLFFDTVRKVNREDYSEEQVEAWAPGVPDPGEWHTRMNGRRTLVAEEEGGVVGFAVLRAARLLHDARADRLAARHQADELRHAKRPDRLKRFAEQEGARLLQTTAKGVTFQPRQVETLKGFVAATWAVSSSLAYYPIGSTKGTAI
jgi:hypothetical protein